MFKSKYPILSSITEMLSALTLSELLGYRVSHVTCRPFEASNGFSTNQLFHVEVGGKKLVMKHLRPKTDWLALVSNDHQCRSIRVWQYGLLDIIQPHMQHGILAVCREGDDFAILMNDVSSGLLNGQALTSPIIYHMLDALAAMHATFWEQEALKAGELGLLSVETIFSFIGPLQEEYYQHAPHILEMIQQGRSALFDLVEPDVSKVLQALIEDPQPLRKFMEKFPATFVHTDFRQDNLAIIPDTQALVVFDWQMAGYAPPILDICWLIGSLPDQLDQHEDYYSYYQQNLSAYLADRFDPNLWQPMLEVGCLLEVLRKGNWHALFAVTSEDVTFRAVMKRSVESYNDIVRKGLAWL